MELVQDKTEQETRKIPVEIYLSSGTEFTIPSYQRGYKWGVKKDGNCAVGYFCDSLIDAFKKQLSEYFIEAVTVVEENEKEHSYILVDGQQRTTTLFLLFLALEDYAFLEPLTLKYDVRIDSHTFLTCKKQQAEFDGDSDTQDIYYFKRALETIRGRLNTFDDKEKHDFNEYIKKNVKLLRNDIPPDKAVNTFIALNGLKAKMLDEELIKSQLLIQASRPLSASSGQEFKISEDRSRMARNWDKWLYWWNQEEVKQYFRTVNHHPLYFLLVTYWQINKAEEEQEFSFAGFNKKFLGTNVEAKRHFEGLRKLQKRFEDAYNHYESYNFLGIILRTSNDREKALLYFIRPGGKKYDYKNYALWSLIYATHDEIVEDKIEQGEDGNVIIKERKATDAVFLMDEEYVYWDENDKDFPDKRKELAFRFLLLLNILRDNTLQRKFDFEVWNNRSLEHIQPKSKAKDYIFSKGSKSSIHCIGNLVLLYSRNNSEFNDKEVEEKKRMFFNVSQKETFKSRNLLHTLSVFAHSNWSAEKIAENKNNVVSELKKLYGLN